MANQTLYDGDTFEHEGAKFRVTFPRDDDMGEPWKEHDGHGPVSEWTTRNKLPGERVLCEDRSNKRFYDVAEAIRIAKRDGWDAEPYGGTKGERAARAVAADFKHLQGWCNDSWHWIGVQVELLDDEGEPMGITEAVWGIESNSGDYLLEAAKECAAELLAKLKACAA